TAASAPAPPTKPSPATASATRSSPVSSGRRRLSTPAPGSAATGSATAQGPDLAAEAHGPTADALTWPARRADLGRSHRPRPQPPADGAPELIGDKPETTSGRLGQTPQRTRRTLNRFSGEVAARPPSSPG